MATTASARTANALFLLAAFAVLTFAMYPGRFDGDAISSYRQGLNFYFNDASSVWTSVLMGALADIAPGPAPMFVLQLILWIGGLLVFSDVLIRAGRPLSGQAVSLLSMCPLLSFDFFDVQKDAFLSALLIVLIAAGAARLLLGHRFTLVGLAALIMVFLLTLDTRHNAAFALFPVLLLVRPIQSLRPRAWLLPVGLALGLLVAGRATLETINHGPIPTDRARFSYAVAIYDLAGISVRIHQDASRGRLPDFLNQAQACYSPHEWDAFQGGPCRPTGQLAEKLMMDDRTRGDLTGVWAGAILRHPVAYGAHRARHFGCLLSLGCQRVHQLMTPGWWPRDWDEPHMRVSGSARAISALAVWLWKTPLGMGALWLAVLLGELAAAAWTLRRTGFEPVAYLGAIMSASGLGYLGSFAVGGISDQMRYLHPVIFLAVAALPLCAASLRLASETRSLSPPVAAPSEHRDAA